MQEVKNKFKNIRNEHLKFRYKHSHLILCLKQPKNLFREFASSKFISNFKNIRKLVTYKCSDKRCRIYENYLNETNKFTMSNGQIWENRREIDCHSVKVIYYLSVKCIMKKKHILGKQ